MLHQLVALSAIFTINAYKVPSMPIFVRESGGFVEMRNVYVREGSSFTQIQNAWVRESTGWTLVYRRAFVFNTSVNSSTNNSFNLRSQAISAGWDQVVPLEASVTINAQQGSNSSAAFIADGSYPAGSVLNLEISTAGDSIRGLGGIGGNGGRGSSGSGRTDGATGGTAIFIRNIPTNLTNRGTIAAGGTGGDGGVGLTRSGGPGGDPIIDGGGGGGGGAGSPAGSGGNGGDGDDPLGIDGVNGTGGTLTGGGSGGSGAPGAQSGTNGFGPGQGPTTDRTGRAIDGVSNVTFVITGTILGRQVN